jgi:Zn-dependent protease
MFGKPIRVGRLFGIELTISWSFVVLVAALSIYFALQSPHFALGLVVGMLSLALVFGSVLAHELGHSLVAQRLGVKIAEIELHFFGGAAKMLSMPKKPRDEILIAAAGPAVSFALAGLFWGISALGFTGMGIIGLLAAVNVMLGAFNLIPALPTDGGRILRAALQMKHGPLRATELAVKVARAATIAIGLWALLSGNYFGVAIAVFIWMLGSRELRMAHMLYGNGHATAARQHIFESTPRAPQVEVYDRFGNYIGSAPGGVESTTVKPPQPRVAPQSRRRVLVQGADGRLWVVTERVSQTTI